MNVGQYIEALKRSGWSNEKSVVYAVGFYRKHFQTPVKDLWRFLTKKRKAIVKEKFSINVKRNVLEAK